MSKVVEIPNSDKFNFFVPIEFKKGSDVTGKGKYLMRVKGIASTIDEDSDQEQLDAAGFDCSELLSSGMANWNHQATKTSSAICGIPVKASLVPGKNGVNKSLELEIDILNNTEGRSLAELIETLDGDPNRKIGMSIEGRKVAVDPFNSKKITKAIISGVAFTHQPKNKNTFVSIMKGEYTEAFVPTEEPKLDQLVKEYNEWIQGDSHKGQEGSVKEFLENYHEDHLDLLLDLMNAINSTTEKAMDVQAISPAMPESVEGAPKNIINNNAKEFGNLLKKSDIYISIISKYNTPIAETKKIYSLIEKTQKNFFSMATKTETPITNEVLQKSFELLDEAIALVKGNSDNMGDLNGKTNDVDLGKVINKSEDNIDPAHVEKSKDTAGILFKAGMDKETACNTMVKGGIALAVAQGAWESVIADANANKQGGDIVPVTAPIVKSEDAIVLHQEITKSLLPIQEAFQKGFEGSNAILKGLVESNTELQKNNNLLIERLEKLESTTPGRKSLTGVAGLERFQKSEDNDAPIGTEVINVGSKDDLTKLVKILDGANDVIKANSGKGDMFLEKAIESIEICQVVPEECYSRLRGMNIILQAPSKK